MRVRLYVRACACACFAQLYMTHHKKSCVSLSAAFYVRWASSSASNSANSSTCGDSMSNPSDVSDMCSSVSGSDLSSDCGSVFDSSEFDSERSGASDCSYDDVHMLGVDDSHSLPFDRGDETME